MRQAAGRFKPLNLTRESAAGRRGEEEAQLDERYDAGALRLARQAAMDGEAVLWAGRPGRRWLPDWPLAHAAVPLVAIAWGFGSIMIEEPYRMDDGRLWLFMSACAAPFALIFAFHLWWTGRRGRAVYAVTDRRVLILAPNGAVWDAVGLEQAAEFRQVGRMVHLGGVDEVWRRGKTDLDGGLARFDALPKLERLADAKRVMATIRSAAARRGVVMAPPSPER